MGLPRWSFSTSPGATQRVDWERARGIADIFTLTTTLPNVTLATGAKFNVKDTASTIIAHARDDIAAQAAIAGEKILSGAASVSINKNFTIADAKAVTGIKTLAKGTVYSITDTADNIH